MATRDAEELPTREAAAEQAALLEIAMLIVRERRPRRCSAQWPSRLPAGCAPRPRPSCGSSATSARLSWARGARAGSGAFRSTPSWTSIPATARRAASGVRAGRRGPTATTRPRATSRFRCVRSVCVLGRHAGHGLGRGLGHDRRRHHARRAAPCGQRAPDRRPCRARGACGRSDGVPPRSRGFAPADRRGVRRGTPPSRARPARGRPAAPPGAHPHAAPGAGACRGPDVTDLLDDAIAEAGAANVAFRELARDLYPIVLSQRGLAAALQAVAARSPVPVYLEELPRRRFPAIIEGTAYFVVAETVAAAAEHLAGATCAWSPPTAASSSWSRSATRASGRARRA